ncbi:hypothetical protein JAAARDRAFT_117612 [Jaapia argillacea MUCL 33604]|uniref:TLC domain-containing protein n=1 Tax=Jaapia argillacea MUCL 33604 TaxID=933084 RepID=A0A067QNQ6_9AGAM|nr:hypothetical protein JAAARDRAFT_117612 [Jaapia argillacea MUCL 33604]
MNNSQLIPGWFPPVLLPFVSLSYPIDTPAQPDSFPNSSYYGTGRMDACLLVTFIAVMAVVRDAARLGVLEPFARWKLTRDLHARRKRKALRLGKSKGAGSGSATPPSPIGNGSPSLSNGDAIPALANGNANGHAEIDREIPEKLPPLSVLSKEEKKIHRSVLRFAEQGYSVIYYAFSWLFGMYVHLNLPTEVLNPTHLWLKYPHTALAAPVKLFYLIQAAFYVHQVLILNAEARRKDHWQMMAHHVITIALVLTSYFYSFTRVGCLIMVVMDWCDIYLPLAKMFRYLNLTTLCDVTFTFFLLSWFVTRHVLLIYVIKSTYYEVPNIGYDWAPERGHYITQPLYVAFVTMLVALQILQILWSWMICRVAWRVVSGHGAEDERSDSEL